MFADRLDAGEKLAHRLLPYRQNALVLGIPRGGLVVAAVIAKRLSCPLWPLIVRKIGFPQNPEFAAGAVGPDGKTVWNESALNSMGLSPNDLSALAERKKQEVLERKNQYDLNWPSLAGQTVLVVDDGAATGSTLQAALLWLKSQKPNQVIVALPCASTEAANRIRALCDRLVCLEEPDSFSAVGEFYRDFPQVTEAQAISLLKS